MPFPTKRILVVRTDRLGDVVLTLPMFALLRKCIPDAYIAAMLSRYTGGIVEGNQNVDEILWYDDRKQRIPFWQMLRLIKGERFDAALVVHPSARIAWLMFLAGVRVRIGTGYRYYSLLFNRRVYEHRKDAARHEVEYNLNLLRELGCRVPDRVDPAWFSIQIPVSTSENAEAILRSSGIGSLKGRVIIHPGSGGSAREWPTGNFGRLAALLAEDRTIQVLVTGGPDESVLVDSVVDAAPDRVVGLAGRFSVRELAAVIRSASLFIGHSTGPLHIAAAVGTPVLGLYPQVTPMSPRRWGPYVGKNAVLVAEGPVDCRECADGRGVPCACMTSIPVERVYSEACKMLLRSTPTASVEGQHES